MATNSKLTVTISAVDRTSQAIDAVAKRLSGITAPVTKVTRSLARLSDASGVTKLSKAILHLGGSAVGAGLRMTEALGPLSGLTAALSLGGLAKVTTDWAKFSQSLGFDAARIGSNVADLHALEGSARLSGSSAEAAAAGLRTLQDVMTDTVDGRNMQALVYFRQLGVSFEDGRGNALRATAVLPKLADAIMRIKDPSRQARVATEFFGGAAESLLPWLRRGSAGMAEYAAMARHYGVQTDDSTDKAGVFELAQRRLALAFEGMGNSISEKVSPPLAHMMTYIAELVNRWRKPISDTLGEWATQAEAWVKAIDWSVVIRSVGELATNFQSLMDALLRYKAPPWLQWVMKQFASDDSGSVADLGGDYNPLVGGAPRLVRGPHGMTTENYQPPTYRQTHDAQPLTPAVTLRNRLLDLTGVDMGDAQGQKPTGIAIMGMLERSRWTHDDAAAIVAGLDRESGLNASIEGDPDRKTGIKQAYGVAQWHPPRQAQFNAWSAAGGTDDGRDIRHASLSDQIRFLDWDLSLGNNRAVGDHMRAAKTLADKVTVFDKEYERPKDVAGAVETDVPHAQSWAAAAPPIKVDVNIRGLPAGATATTTSTGAYKAGVRVERAMSP